MTYKYRIYPNREQEIIINHTFNCCRLVYNLALEVKKHAYRSHGKILSALDLCYQLIDLKKEYKWLQEVDSQALQASIKRIDVAYKNFFFKGSGYPKFKSKNNAQSFQCPNNTRRIDFENGLLTIPKIKNIPISISKVFYGKIKTITISKTATDKYFASIMVDNGNELPNKYKILEQESIGIDLGLKDFAVLSDGEKINNPKYLRNNLKRLKCLNKRASRKKKRSKNRIKAFKVLALHHEYIANMRKDFLHKLTTKLVRDNQATTFCMEDLNIKGIIKNRKLSQSVSDVGWGEFIRQMQYKCNWHGKNFIYIGRYEPSSQLCNTCGSKNETLSLKQREWTCANCLTTHDRDINAAKNIKYFGLKLSGWGTPVETVELLPLGRTEKQ